MQEELRFADLGVCNITVRKHSLSTNLTSKNSYWDQCRAEILTQSNSKKAKEILKSYDILIPTAIFLERKLSFSETLVEYLREVYKLSYHQIAILTNRDERNTWTLYNRASKKRQGELFTKPNFQSNAFFPLSILSEGKKLGLSPLESTAFFLKTKGLQNQQISILLGRSSKTIWTVINRASVKKNKVSVKKLSKSENSRGGTNA